MYAKTILFLLGFFSVDCFEYNNLQTNLANQYNLLINKSHVSSQSNLEDLLTQYNLIKDEKENIINQLNTNLPNLNVSLPCLDQLSIIVPSLLKREPWTFRGRF